MNKYFLFICVCLISSCSAMSKDECRQANWSDIGKKDGVRGKLLDRFDEYEKSCAKAGITADKAMYEAGRNEGLKSYCTIINGYAEGEKGSTYNNVCGGFDEPTFLKGYKLGSELYGYAKAVSDANARVEKLDKDVGTMQDEIKTMQSDLGKEGISYQERQTKMDLINAKQNNIDALKNTRYGLEDKVEQKKKAYEAMKKTHTSMGFCATEGCFSK